jgi:hypothetical protein
MKNYARTIERWLPQGRGCRPLRGQGNSVETEEIQAYTPVAIAGLGWLPDTILSRSVIVRMRRRHAGESVEPYPLRRNMSR